MYRRDRAFTLAELLTVLAIIAVLAGVLFPVLSSAKASVKRAQCLSNMHQAQLATSQYMTDYDEFFMPVNHRPGANPNPLLDRTWVQLVLPYAHSFDIFTCPADTGARDTSGSIFDQDLVPGDIYAQYYTASMHVDMGYNYLYLSPIVMRRGQYVSEPKPLASVNDPSKTLLFADSIWDRTPGGEPVGGGNWLVVPPCRYVDAVRQTLDSFDGAVYTPFYGWKVDQPNSPHVYGNAWPWHFGRVNITRVDGSVTSVSLQGLTAGCDVKEGWTGPIKNLSEYMWDTH